MTKRFPQFVPILVILALASPTLPHRKPWHTITASAEALELPSRTSAGVICGDSVILGGPTEGPASAVVVQPGQNVSDATNASPAGTTFYLTSGTHTLVGHESGQIIPKDGNTYIGAPGAVLDGQGINRYAFTQKAAAVTIRHLTITGFMAPGDEGVVNHDHGAGWVIERNTITRNNGAGVLLGDDNVLSQNCLADNGQYGFQAFGANLTIDGNEVARNNTTDWETNEPGCGCSGGAKFWSSGPGTVTNNWVHDNMNVGLWWDNNNAGFLVEGNTIEGNRAHGIEYETSYNVIIRNNVLRRNAVGMGQTFQARNDPFPIGSVYLSEASGEDRVGQYPTVELSGNHFEENWGGIVAWENADRFGHDDSANTSKGFTTLLIDPSGTHGSFEMWKCGDPANGGLINTEPYFTDCRWRTANLLVTGNTFAAANKAALGCTTDLCNQSGLFSNYGTVPSWSPYLGRVVQENITFNQNNRWSANTYTGDWRFAAYEAVGPTLSFAEWQAAPYNQDAGSTYSGSTEGTTTTTTAAEGITTDLALSQPAQASSQFSGDYPASAAVDGDSTTTRWASAPSSAPEWLQVDLGTMRDFSQVVLKWDPAYATAYTLQASPDGVTWTDIYSTAAGDGGTDTVDVAASGRYVRWQGQVGALGLFSLYEFAVRG